MRRHVFALLSATLASACCGCAYVPNYDVQSDRYGLPTVKTIVDRIRCELVDMVRSDRSDDVAANHRDFLLNQDYDVEATLSLEVNDTGGLAPSFSSIVPYSAVTSLAVSATGTFSQSRDQNFTENLHFNLRELFKDWQASQKTHGESICPAADTNLAGDLGLRNIVAMADSSSFLDEAQTLGPGKGAFGGSVQFLVTKSLTSAGPTWTLTHFKGPGGLASFSRVNTDKLTVAFAEHADAGPKKPGAATPRNQRAYELLLQIQTNSINSELLILSTPH
jgi:hypothetical protein